MTELIVDVSDFVIMKFLDCNTYIAVLRISWSHFMQQLFSSFLLASSSRMWFERFWRGVAPSHPCKKCWASRWGMTFLVSSLPHFQHYTDETLQIEPFRTSAVDCINNWVEYCFSYPDWANFVIFLSPFLSPSSFLLPKFPVPKSSRMILKIKLRPTMSFLLCVILLGLFVTLEDISIETKRFDSTTIV